jgi:hypothetical protein
MREALETAGIDRVAARDAVEHKDVDISLALLRDTSAAPAPREGEGGSRPATA